MSEIQVSHKPAQNTKHNAQHKTRYTTARRHQTSWPWRPQWPHSCTTRTAATATFMDTYLWCDAQRTEDITNLDHHGHIHARRRRPQRPYLWTLICDTIRNYHKIDTYLWLLPEVGTITRMTISYQKVELMTRLSISHKVVELPWHIDCEIFPLSSVYFIQF